MHMMLQEILHRQQESREEVMLQANLVSKKFDDTLALNQVSCTIPQGCIYGLVGSNGAGKSTLLRLLTGIYKADGGQVLLDGMPVYDNPEAKEKIVYVSDELYFLPGANLKRMASLYGSIYKNFSYSRFQELRELFQLPEGKAIQNFSKGMKRQAAVMLALSAGTEYLIFDETFDGLDPIMRNLLKSLVCEDVAGRQATVIITSHSLRELEDVCDQLAMLHKGGLVLESEIENLKTSLFKVQVAFHDAFDADTFKELDVLQYTRMGSVARLIVRGDREETTSILRSKEPLLLDILPLTLEEVFTYELEAIGYQFPLVDER